MDLSSVIHKKQRANYTTEHKQTRCCSTVFFTLCVVSLSDSLLEVITKEETFVFLSSSSTGALCSGVHRPSAGSCTSQLLHRQKSSIPDELTDNKSVGTNQVSNKNPSRLLPDFPGAENHLLTPEHKITSVFC